MKKLRLLLILAAAISLLALPLTAQETDEKKVPEKVEKTTDEGEIKLIESKPFYYCAIEMTGSYEQHPSAFMSLYSAAAQQSLPMDETPFGIYWNRPDGTPEEELKWDIGFAIPDDAEIKEPLKKKKWDYTHLLTAGFEGAYESLEMYSVHAAMYEWAEKNGYEPAGPMMEKFLNTPMPNDKGEIIGKVEMIVPVVKKKK